MPARGPALALPEPLGHHEEAVSTSYQVTDADREHFRRVAAGNRAAETEHLAEVMRLTPGERIEQAIELSDLYLAGRPSPERRDELVSLAARWRALHASTDGP